MKLMTVALCYSKALLVVEILQGTDYKHHAFALSHALLFDTPMKRCTTNIIVFVMLFCNMLYAISSFDVIRPASE